MHEHHRKIFGGLFFSGEMQLFRDIIIGLTSKGLFVLPCNNEKRMIFPGMNAIMEANSMISLSLMSSGGKLHWASIEIGLVFSPGLAFSHSSSLTAIYSSASSRSQHPSAVVCVPVITWTLEGAHWGWCRAANSTHVNSVAIPCHCLDRNKFVCYAYECHMYVRRSSIII